MSANEEFYTARIQALETEVQRLNNELRSVKEVAFKVKLTDPNFDKPLNEVNVEYEIIKTN